jgi:hypothetical protein
MAEDTITSSLFWRGLDPDPHWNRISILTGSGSRSNGCEDPKHCLKMTPPSPAGRARGADGARQPPLTPRGPAHRFPLLPQGHAEPTRSGIVKVTLLDVLVKKFKYYII